MNGVHVSLESGERCLVCEPCVAIAEVQAAPFFAPFFLVPLADFGRSEEGGV